MNFLDDLKVLVDCWVSSGTFPNLSLTLLNAKDDIFHYSYGSANESGNPINQDTIFRIYSMSKPIVSVAAMIFYARGLLSPSDPVSKFLPSFNNLSVYVSGSPETNDLVTEPLHTPMTIHHLLTHTSGLTYGIFDNTIPDRLLQKLVGPESCSRWFSDLSLELLCEYLSQTPLSYQPGTSFLYSLSTDVLGRVLEVASGRSLNEILQTEIFDPLGMKDTGFSITSDDQLLRLASCSFFLPGFGHEFRAPIETNRDHRATGGVPPLLSGGGGLISTSSDYSKFVRMLLNFGRFVDSEGLECSLLSEEIVKLMIRNHIPEDQSILTFAKTKSAFNESVGDGIGFGYGFSVILNPSVVRGGQYSSPGECGWGGVASTWFFLDPERKTSAIVMTQLVPSSSQPLRLQLRYLANRCFYRLENSETESNEK